MKAAVGDHQILCLLAVNLRPRAAGRDCQLYGVNISKYSSTIGQLRTAAFRPSVTAVEWIAA